MICADLTSALGNDPHSRPARASVVVALLWCALVTSLGSTMTAVAGLALHAGYHDSHVGVTKRIVRFLRQWRDDRKARKNAQHVEAQERSGTDVHVDIRAVSPALSAVTDGHREQHLAASFRAAVVSSRVSLPSPILLWAVELTSFIATRSLRSSLSSGYCSLSLSAVPYIRCGEHPRGRSNNSSRHRSTNVANSVSRA